MDVRYTILVILFAFNVIVLSRSILAYARFLPRRIPQLGKCLLLMLACMASAMLSFLGIVLPQGGALTVVVTLNVIAGYVMNALLTQLLLCMMGFNQPHHLIWQRVLYAIPLAGVVTTAVSALTGEIANSVVKIDRYTYTIHMSISQFILATISSLCVVLILIFAAIAIIRKRSRYMDKRVILCLSGAVLVPSLLKYTEALLVPVLGQNYRISTFTMWIPMVVICYICFGYLRSARAMAVNRTDEIYIVFDRWGTVVDINPAARAFFESHGFSKPPKFEQFTELLGGNDLTGDFSLVSNGVERFYRSVDFRISNSISQHCGEGFIIREVTEYHERMDELNTMAIVDGLTGMQNRRSFDNNAPLAVLRAEKGGDPLTVLMIDIDHFKLVNDTYGHSVGDEVLRDLCRTCTSRLRKRDVMYRYGGEEFVIVCEETGPREGLQMAERLRRAVAENPVHTSAGDIEITVSIGGCSLYADADDSILRWVDLADKNMYAAKQTGRNRVVFLSE